MSRRDKEFYTVRGYTLHNHDERLLSACMEDYLEMVFRLIHNKGYTRIGDLAGALNVQPPSASKMVQKLTQLGYLNYEKYGIIQLTTSGKELGEYLLKRHHIIEKFLTLIGVSNGVLEETEKIEHNISKETLMQIEKLVGLLENNKDLIKEYLG